MNRPIWLKSLNTSGYLAALLLPTLLFCAATAQAAKPDALRLMKDSDKRHRLSSEKTEAKMILQKQGGEAQARQLSTWTVLDDDKGDKMRVRFSAPANIKGTALLTLEDPSNKNDEQWLYLPAFNKTRRVGQAELGDRFVGSDIFYEDLQQREIEDYSYKILGSEKIDGHDCWVIESTPSKAKVVKESPYGKSHIFMRKDNLFVPMVRFFDKRMRPLKELHSEDAKAVTDKAWRADKTTIFDAQRKHRTVLLIESRQVNPEIAESLFSKHTMDRKD